MLQFEQSVRNIALAGVTDEKFVGLMFAAFDI
jgi:hypothetical protein